MDATEVYFALRELGAAPALDKGRDQLLIDPPVELSPQLAEAFAANHERLLKQALLSEVLRFVHERIRRREGRSPEDYSVSPAAAATFARMAADEHRISEAFESQGVEGFKDTLRQWSRAAISVYEQARVQGESSAKQSPGSASVIGSEQRTDTAPTSANVAPVQDTLL